MPLAELTDKARLKNMNNILVTLDNSVFGKLIYMYHQLLGCGCAFIEGVNVKISKTQ